jgi:hypothetical protein
MDSPEKITLTEIKKQFADYLELRLEVIKLFTYEKTARIGSGLASALVLIFLSLFFLLFLFVTLGFYFSSLTGSYTIGFGIITGFYLILLLVFIALRKKVFEKFLSNKIIENLTDDD